MECDALQGSNRHDSHMDFGSEVPSTSPIRWVVLGCFSLATLLNAFAWIMFAPITKTVQSHFGVSSLEVDLLSMIFMGTYIAFAIPALRIMDQFELRGGIVAGTFLTALGGWIRCIGGYPFLLFGQALISLGQLPLLGAPPKVSLTWFGSKEWSTATAIGVLANQAGGAFAYLISPRAVPSPDGSAMETYLIYQAAACTASFALAFLLIPQRPAQPASFASAMRNNSAAGAGLKSLTWAAFLASTARDISSFVTGGTKGRASGALLTLSYGVAVGVFYAVSTLLASLVAPMALKDTTVGLLGFFMGAVGLVGSIASGLFLDRTKLFQASTTGLMVCSALSLAAFVGAVHARSTEATFAAVGAVGFFLTGVLPVGFEFAAELSFPIPEDSVATLLNISGQVFGIAFILATTTTVAMAPAVQVWVLVAAMVAAAAATHAIHGETRRQDAQATGLGLGAAGGQKVLSATKSELAPAAVRRTPSLSDLNGAGYRALADDQS